MSNFIVRNKNPSQTVYLFHLVWYDYVLLILFQIWVWDVIFWSFYICIKNQINIKFFSTQGYLEDIYKLNNLSIFLFIIFFGQICNVPSKNVHETANLAHCEFVI